MRSCQIEASRRALLRRVGAVLAVVALASRAALAGEGKRSKDAVGYRGTPKGNQRCEICASFLPPDQCRTVIGPVGRQGWCNIYEGPGLTGRS